MKRTCMALVLAVGLVFTVLAASEEAPSKADRFASMFAERLRNAEIEVTEEEEQALRNAHPVLLRLLDSDYASRLILPDFWKIVRQEDPEEVEWEEARTLILSGKVTDAFISHAETVGLLTKDGRRYHTKPPDRAEYNRTIKEADPKGVFIRRWME
jgi:hypothetical protein